MAKYKGPELAKMDIVVQAIDAAARSVAQDAYEDFKQEATQRIELASPEGLFQTGDLEFDSPLEAVYWVWWLAIRRFDPFAELNIALLRHVSVPVSGQTYVIDFVVAPISRKSEADDFMAANFPKIAIELDGHTFHEKTLEQVTYRNERDRNLQRDGWHVFHYSFSEVMEQGSMTVVEPVDFARDAYWRILRLFNDRRKGE